MVDAINSIYSNAGLRTYEDANKTAGRSKSDLGQEDFLELMVAQLRNQDPMAPMENGEFLSQMAQFGTVSGINELQESFSSFSSSVNSGQALQAAGLIGHYVLADNDTGTFSEGGQLEGVIDIPASTPSVKVKVYNDVGQLVRNVDLGGQSSGDMPFAWDGTNNDGITMPAGSYRVTAEARYEGKSEALNVMMGAQVSNVTINPNGGMSLGLAGGGTLEFSKVKQIL